MRRKPVPVVPTVQAVQIVWSRFGFGKLTAKHVQSRVESSAKNRHKIRMGFRRNVVAEPIAKAAVIAKTPVAADAREARR